MSTKLVQIRNGIIAGFAATIVMSLIMVLKKSTGVMPELDPVHMLTVMASQKMGINESPIVGWLIHFMIGAVIWGGIYGAVNNILPLQKHVLKGMMLASVPWLMMMLGAMPMNGAGMFGLKISIMVPVFTIIVHLIYGAVLGRSYGLLNGE
jgi:Family of unknown function (DUF6789)